MEQEIVFTFGFNFTQLNAIIKGLKKLPYEESSELIQGIIQGHAEQLKEKEEAARKKIIEESKDKKEVDENSIKKLNPKGVKKEQ